MSDRFTRKPIGNFFIKRELQLRLIVKIMFAVVLSVGITAGILLAIYYLRYKSIIFYRMDVDLNLAKENVIDILLPTVVFSAMVNIIVAFAVGLYASRKYALPVYKLEQWAYLLRSGNMKTKLRFREKDEMKELSTSCNDLANEFLERFKVIKKNINILKQSVNESKEIDEIANMINSLELENETIEVNTSFTHRPIKVKK